MSAATVYTMQAETEQCLDVDTFGDWIGGELHGEPNVAKVATGYAHLPWLSVGELTALLLECGPGQLLEVRDALRARYLATRDKQIDTRAAAIEAEFDGQDAVFERCDIAKDHAAEVAA